MPTAEVRISLDAVIIAVTDETPRVMTVTEAGRPPRLPSGLLEAKDRTLEAALRRFVRVETGLDVGYVEQLYTFGDSDRAAPADGRLLSIAYLALVREARPSADAAWVDCYDLYPWEDHREGADKVVSEVVAPALDAWVGQAPNGAERAQREERAHVVFGLGGAPWDGVRVLERYELLYQVGLLGESPARPQDCAALDTVAMQSDHGRIVATALGRLRGKLTYRPVVFEMLPESFTLFQLQRLVEALSGVRLHKQNFRRLAEGGGLVEGTGRSIPTGGRPAELFRFRRDVLRERPRPGVGMPWTRA